MDAVLRLLSRRWAAPALVALILVLIAGLVVVVVHVSNGAPNEPAAVDCHDAVRESVEEASAVAGACGIDVEIAGERTPWETSWATAEGNSRIVVTAAPTATNVNGEWDHIDPTISDTPADDGMMPSTAPVFRTSFNPGGEAGTHLPLAEIEREGKVLKLWFPLPLGDAVVEGAAVTYLLFEGASLTVYVNESGTGFAPVLMLDSPAAAADFETRLAAARAALDLPGDGWDLPFKTEISEGLTVSVGPNGAFEIADEFGDVSFSAPPSQMWDASAGEPDATATPVPTLEEGDVPPPTARGADPWPGDATYEMPVRFEEHSLVVTPSRDFLTDPDVTWPVRIDPKIEGQGAAEWTMLRTGGFTSSVWKFSDISPGYPGGGMGRCNESSCNATYTARLVWEFSGMSGLRAAEGADVIDAQFRVRGMHSYNCTAQRANLHKTSAISSSSTWSSVNWGEQISYRTDAHRDSCDNIRYVEYDATSAAQMYADDNLTSIALGLKANNETTMAGWKRFQKNATLQVDYNRTPNVPTVVSLLTPAKSCATGTAAPYISTLTPTIQAKGSDPDSDDKIAIEFVVVNVATNVWVYNPEVSGRVDQGTVIKRTVTSGLLQDNTRYRYRVRAWDGAKLSGWSAVCEFVTAVAQPASPVLVATSGGPATYTANVETGGVGVAGNFQVSVTAPTTLSKIELSTSGGTVSPSTINVSGSGPWTVTFTPSSTGRKSISAIAYSKSNVASPTKTVYADVAGPREGAIWMLDEGTGTTAADTAGNTPPRPLTYAPGAWTAGPHALFGSRPTDKALLFDGVNDAATTTGAPLTTNQAYTVSAFVWLNSSTSSATALSQDGSNVSVFELGYRTSCALTPVRNCWAFTIRSSDANAATETRVLSSVPVRTGEWVHLVADRNAAGTQSRLWVCPIGSPEAPQPGKPTKNTTTLTGTGWKAEGSFALGRGKENGAATRWWPGRVDNVRLFPGQVMSESKVRRMCSGAEASDFGGSQEALDPTIED